MGYRLAVIETVDSLRRQADAWDDLWHRSEVAMPTKRAAMLGEWLERFAAGRRFVAPSVFKDGRLLAALPIVESRLANVVRVGKLPVNCWSSAGDLLLDKNCDQQAVLACLVAGIRRLPWPILWFDTIEFEMPRWQAFREAVAAARLPSINEHLFDLGLIDIEHDWPSYEARWSKNHRKQIGRTLRQAREQGKLELKIHRDVPPDEVDQLLAEGLEVEDRSWKGPAGTSVLRSPQALRLLQHQARLLAAWGQLEMLTLTLDRWPIAFEYGYRAKGVYFSHKVGYDEAYRQLAPGQLLMRLQLQRYHGEPDRRLLNCMGILSEAAAKWCTRSRPIGRAVVGTGGPTGAGLVAAYRHLRPLGQRVRDSLMSHPGAAPPPRLGAESAERDGKLQNPNLKSQTKTKTRIPNPVAQDRFDH
jgi:CelD/BcsL family acetyltransferase involved in cellulose biosynthesis